MRQPSNDTPRQRPPLNQHMAWYGTARYDEDMRMWLLLMVLCPGCHVLLPFGALAPDADPDTAGALDATAPRDTVVPPDATACIVEHFTGPIGTWEVDTGPGNWIWDGSDNALQREEGDVFAYAQVKGSGLHARGGFVATTEALLDSNTMGKDLVGGGLTLLLPGNPPEKHAFILCGCWFSKKEQRLSLDHVDGPEAKLVTPIKEVALQTSPRVGHRHSRWRASKVTAHGPAHAAPRWAPRPWKSRRTCPNG